MISPLEQTIRTNYDRLPIGDCKLADVVLEMRWELAACSATELAESGSPLAELAAAQLHDRLGDFSL